MRRALDNPPFHLFALTALTVAQPLFDLLGRQPEFLITRHLQPGEILGLVAIVFFGLPAVLITATEVAGRILAAVLRRDQLRDLSYAAAVALAATLLFLLILRRLPALPGVAHLPLSMVLATLAAVYYRRSPTLRLFCTLLVLPVLALPLVFLFLTPVADQLAPAEEALPGGAADEEISRPVPVVLVVFDELPTSSLIDAEGRIDDKAFPHFAALAATSTWYRDATSVATLTLAAIPAILTGQYPRAGALPTLRDHPRNLLSLLSERYSFHVLEPHTELTPRRHAAAGARHWPVLLQDLGVIYLHLVAPPPFAERLPPITTWQLTELADRARDFRRRLAGLERRRKPPLVFLHSDLPHHPWIYLPSGKRYLTAGEFVIDGLEHGRGPASARWTKDGWPVVQAYQRHLLQLAFTDRLLGELEARLRQLELFDRALVIVTADHGISFIPGGLMRKIDLRNSADVMSVPLFIKLPGQRRGAVRGGSVELIDILPTIRDVLGLGPDPSLPGISLLGELPASRPKLVYHTPQHQLRFPRFDPSGKDRGARRRSDLFPAGGSAPIFHPASAFRQLLGRSPLTVATRTARGLEARIDDTDRFTGVDLEADALPCRLSGRVREPHRGGPAQQRQAERPAAATLAVAINGRIAAMTRTRRDAGYAGRFSAMIPERALRPGRNHLELFVAAEEAGVPVLEPVALEPTVTYDLILGPAGEIEALRSSAGELHTVDRGYFDGQVVGVMFADRGFRVELVGWARNRHSGEVPKAIAVFTDGRWIHTGLLNLADPEVAASYAMPGKEDAGFVFLIPRRETEGEVRFFAVAEHGSATELRYTRSMKPRASRFVDQRR